MGTAVDTSVIQALGQYASRFAQYARDEARDGLDLGNDIADVFARLGNSCRIIVEVNERAGEVFDNRAESLVPEALVLIATLPPEEAELTPDLVEGLAGPMNDLAETLAQVVIGELIDRATPQALLDHNQALEVQAYIDSAEEIEHGARTWRRHHPPGMDADLPVVGAHLVELLGDLFGHSDELERQLEAALADLEGAQRTIEVLRAQNEALRAALATGAPATRRRLVTSVARGLVPLLTFVAGHTAAMVAGQYDVRVAEISADSEQNIADAEQRTAVRVARITAEAEIEAARIAHQP